MTCGSINKKCLHVLTISNLTIWASPRLKKIMRKRSRLRLVVASATLDAGAFLSGWPSWLFQTGNALCRLERLEINRLRRRCWHVNPSLFSIFLYSQSYNQVISNPGVVVATLEFERHFLQHKARKGAGGKCINTGLGHQSWPLQFSSVTGNEQCGNNTHAYISISIRNVYGGFPKIGVPPKHPKMIIFSRKTHGCWVPLFLETPIYQLSSIQDKPI